MENIPLEELQVYKRLESQFDQAYLNLIVKLNALGVGVGDDSDNEDHDGGQPAESEDSKPQVEHVEKEESNNQPGLSEEDSKMSNVAGVKKNDEANGDHHHLSHQHGDKNIAASENSDDGDDDDIGGNGASGGDGNDITILNELITMVLSYGKLMTKAFLNAERVHQLSQQVRRLKKENCLLQAVAKNCHQYHKLTTATIAHKPPPSSPSSGDPAFVCQPGTESGDRSDDAGITGKKLTDLITLKQAIEQEVDELLATKDAQMQLLKMKFKNKIIALNLAVDWLKKETAGRVQQLQLLIRQMESNSPAAAAAAPDILDEENARIWKHLCHEVLLNRHKTIVRMADIAGQIDSMQDKTDDQQPVTECTGEDLANTFNSVPPSLELTKANSENIIRLGQLLFKWIYLKKDAPVGLGLIGGTEDIPLVVWKVLPDHVAASYFRPGDIIVSMQFNTVEHDMTGMDRDDAVKLIGSASGWCRFGIVRVPIKKIEQHLQEFDCFNFEICHDDSFQLSVL